MGGTLDFAPALRLLRESGVSRADVTVRHPRTGYSTFTANGWQDDRSPQFVEYNKNLDTGTALPAVHVAFGYRIVNFLPLTLLLFPIALTLVMRWAALRSNNLDPVTLWFTYWRLFGWVMTGAWLIWMEGSTVMDCNALARFLLNDSPKSPLLQVAFYLVPPVLVQLIATLSAGAVLARVTGGERAFAVSAKHAFWHEPVTILPLACLLAGVASLALYDEFILGIACLAFAYLSRLACVWLWLRFQGLARYVMPAGDLRTHILELSGKAGVKIREIYLLPFAEGRLASPLMTRGLRLFLSEALLRSMSAHELDAVLAREFVHLRRRHRPILLGATVASLPLIYRFSHLPAVAGVPWAIRGPMLVWLTPILLYLLWRRFDRDTENQAAMITGDREALTNAVNKMAQLNLLSLYWRRFDQRLFPNTAERDWGGTPEAAASEAGLLTGPGTGSPR